MEHIVYGIKNKNKFTMVKKFKKKRKKILFIVFMVILVVGIGGGAIMFNPKQVQVSEDEHINQIDEIISYGLEDKLNDKENNSPTIIGTSIPKENIWRIVSKTGNEEYLDTNYEIINETATKFCVNFNNKTAYEDATSLSNHEVNEVPIIKDDSKDNRFTLEKSDIDLTKATEKDSECFIVNYPKFEKGMAFKVGWETIVYNSSQEGIGADTSFQDRVFHNNNHNTWHVLYINNLSDIYISSSKDGITWIGVNISIGDFDYDDFDSFIHYHGSETYLHVVSTDEDTDTVEYGRFILNGTSPYVFGSTTETVFDASAMGESADDDAQHPRIVVDSNNCSLITFDLEDDSETDADEHEVVLIREAGNSSVTCGDGDFDYNEDIAEGFPIYSIQSETGYNDPFAIGIDSFGDLDAQITWIDTDTAGAFQLETIYFNGTSNTTGTQQTLDADVEGVDNNANYYSLINEENTVIFAADDDTTFLDAYIITSKDGALDSQTNTGLSYFNTEAWVSGNIPGQVTAVTLQPKDSLLTFAVPNYDYQDIVYSFTDSNITNWIGHNSFEDEVAISEMKYLSVAYDNKTCGKVMVSWISGAVAPHPIYIKLVDLCETNLTLPNDEATGLTSPINILANITTETNIKNISLYTNITGSWTLNTTVYPELPSNQSYDALNNINMSGNVLLMHLNNDSNYGEACNDTYKHFHDFSGNANHGNTSDDIYCPSSVGNDGRFKGGGNFDGVGDRIEIQDSPSLNIQGPFTLTAWVTINRAFGSGFYSNIIAKDTIYASGYGLNLYEKDGDEQYLQVWSRGASLQDAHINVVGYWKPNVWYFVAGTYDGTDLHLYLNGIFAEAISSGVAPGSTQGDLLRIGDGANSADQEWPGKIDEVSIWNRSLSRDEIINLYNSSKYYKTNFTDIVATSGTYKWNTLTHDYLDSHWADNNFTFTVGEAEEDTCTYDTGDWYVDCSDNCVIASAVDLEGNTLSLQGKGTFSINAIISNVSTIIKDNKCTVVKPKSIGVMVT